MSILKLPNEILELVLLDLTRLELARFAQTCKEYRKIVQLFVARYVIYLRKQVANEDTCLCEECIARDEPFFSWTYHINPSRLTFHTGGNHYRWRFVTFGLKLVPKDAIGIFIWNIKIRKIVQKVIVEFGFKDSDTANSVFSYAKNHWSNLMQKVCASFQFDNIQIILNKTKHSITYRYYLDGFDQYTIGKTVYPPDIFWDDPLELFVTIIDDVTVYFDPKNPPIHYDFELTGFAIDLPHGAKISETD